MTLRPLLLQVHWTDLRSCPTLLTDESVSLVHRALSRFDSVVLVCGDCPENAEVVDYAESVGVDCFLGDMDDVALRFETCMERFGFQQAARALGYWFQCDTDLVHRCFDVLESQDAEIAVFPRDFDARFGADVFSLGFLRTFRDVLDVFPEDIASQLRFRPWAAVELEPHRFRVAECHELPVYDRSEFDRISRVYNEHHPERFLAAQSPLGAYRRAQQLVSGLDRVADIACGWGDGTQLLARECGHVLGVEYCADQTAHNRERFGSLDNVEFITGDALDSGLIEPEAIDAIVSVHTMEHLQDDERFLANCARWLRPGGTLVLEVPLLPEYPFVGIEEPLGDKHFREYRIGPLMELCEKRFEVEEKWGVARGLYVDVEHARNAVMLVLRRPAL